MQKDLSLLTDKELQRLRKEKEDEISRYNNLQLSKKVGLNSAYGALG